MTTILPWAISILATTPDRWLRLAHGLPEDLLKRPPAAGEWTAVDCLHHLNATENVFAARLQAFLSGRESFPAYHPDAPHNRPDPSVSALELAEEFARRRSASLESLRGLAESELGRTARHAELGPVSLDQMVNEWAAHDLNHTVQAERALMQPFLAGCGPWIVYFEDHVMGEGRGEDEEL
jgi:hypothetical protein